MIRLLINNSSSIYIVADVNRVARRLSAHREQSGAAIATPACSRQSGRPYLSYAASIIPRSPRICISKSLR